MKKIITMMAMGLAVSVAMAQETYESAALATEDLNGTARYVGMGGAMEALGADISTISTNPAGVGLFRRSWVGVSAGLTHQSDGNKGVTNADMNQMGVVFSIETGERTNLNFAANFHKSRNFNQVLTAIGALDGASANKFAAYKHFYDDGDGYSLRYVDKLYLTGYNANLDYMSLTDDVYNFTDMGVFNTENRTSGYIGQYDFNISGRVNDKLFLGVSVGVKDVHYLHENSYIEEMPRDGVVSNDISELYNVRRITGTGYDVKFGMIFRPLYESPFRIGLYINTPTWYNLRSSDEMRLTSSVYNADEGKIVKDASPGVPETNIVRYRIVTPWKFGASLGHTIGSSVALGATFEYSDYSSIKNKYVDTEYYDRFYNEYSYSYTNEREMNFNTEQNLRGVCLLKVGAEVKPADNVALRLGYNWQSPIYKTDATKMWDIYSDGNYNTTNDFTNWESTHRVTFGLGIALSEKVSMDLSYQFATQKGKYHTFEDMEFYDENGVAYDTNYANVVNVKNNRHQFNLSLAYKF